MNARSFWPLTICWIIALLVPISGARAADPTPEEILKTAGLTKQGNFYVLDGDAKLAVSLRAWKAAQTKYNEAMRRRYNLEHDIRAAKTTLQNLNQQNEIETNRLESMKNIKSDVKYNRQVGVVNGIRGNIREGRVVVEQRQKTLDTLDDPTDEYTAATQKQAQAMEQTAKAYDALAADAAVTGAIAEINKTAKPPVKLGPSDTFKTELPRMRNLQKSIVSATINFDIIGGVPHVPVTLNDSVKTEMIIDSGASTVLLTTDTAAKLKFVPGAGDRTEKFVTADGSVVEGRVVTLASVQLGAFTVENVEAGILPPGTKGADNLLGGTFLRHFVYRMDLAGGSIHMSQIPDSEKPSTRPAAAANPPPQKPVAGDKKAVADPKGATDELNIEALIDGKTELHITSDGIYWKSLGDSKPGRFQNRHEPTYVNGDPWQPEWGKPNLEHGPDQTEPLKLAIGKRVYDFQVLSITKERGKEGMEKRDPVSIETRGDEQVLSVPDHQGGSRWYIIRLTRRAEN